jgi:hypothetical protein
MTVYIVLRNGKVDEVFFDAAAAKAHADNLIRKWNMVEIVERDVKEL